jgi:hypothetical protein
VKTAAFQRLKGWEVISGSYFVLFALVCCVADHVKTTQFEEPKWSDGQGAVNWGSWLESEHCKEETTEFGYVPVICLSYKDRAQMNIQWNNTNVK